MSRVRGTRAIVALLVVTAAGTLAFWTAFFGAGGVLHSRETDVHLAFERSFPAADAWMGLACVVAAAGLVRGRPWAAPAGVAAGSALVFLGLMDVTFDLEQRVYAERSAAVAAEVVIDLWCLAVGPLLIAWFGRRR